MVPLARPEYWNRVKVILKEHYRLARKHSAPHWSDGAKCRPESVGVSLKSAVLNLVPADLGTATGVGELSSSLEE